MITEDEWLEQFWQWCKYLIPNNPNFRDYSEINFVSDGCVSLTFYSKHHRFELTAAGSTESLPKGVLELIMTDNREPLSGNTYIGGHDMLGHLYGDLTEEYFKILLTYLHERVPWLRRRFIKLKDLDNLRTKLGISKHK